MHDTVKTLCRIILLLMAAMTAGTAAAQFPAIRNFGPQDYDAGPQNWQSDQEAARDTCWWPTHSA